MRILAIRGRNLASLAREFEVDLVGRDLGSAGIFAICGPVGAGKSTLLDALCLALFDRTPRLGGRGGVAISEDDRPEEHWLHSHDPRSLLRRGAGEGQAQVDFTGRDGRRYRATWSVRRARRRPDGRIQAQEMSLEDLDRGITVAGGARSEVLLAIRARLGLDFAQFCRSVLLAQGEFAAFLRASADERASLLESLTGADIYRRLSKAAHERRKTEKQRVDNLTVQSSNLELLDAEQRRQLENESAALTAQLELNEIAFELAQGVVKWYATAAGYRDEEDSATVDLQRAHAANQTAAPRRERLAQLVRALPLVPRIEIVTARQRSVVEAVAAQQALEAELSKAKDSLETRREQQRTALGQLSTADGGVPPLLVDHPRWLPSLQRWSRCERATAELETTIEEARTRLDTAEVAHRAAERALQSARQALQAAEFDGIATTRKRLLDDRAALTAGASRMRAWERGVLEVGRQRDELEARQTEQQQLSIGFEALVATRIAAERALRHKRKELEHLRARGDLVAFRSHLVDGAPCPLCGSVEHPEPARGDDAALAAAASEVERAERAREVAADAVREREARRRECERVLVAGREQLQRLEREAETAHARWREVAGDFGDSGVEQHEAELALRERQFAELAERHERAQLAGQRTQDDERRAAQLRQQAKELLRLCVDAAARLAEATAELAAGFAGVADWQGWLRAAGDGALAQLARLAAEETSCRKSEATMTLLAQQLETQRSAVAREEREFASASAALATATLAEQVSAAVAREAADLGREAIAREQEVLRGLAEAESSARAVLQKCAAIRKKHENRDRPAIAEDDARQALEDTREARRVAVEQLDAVRARLTFDDLMRRQLAEIEPRLRAAEAALEVWAALDDLIGHSRGDSFAVFAQGLTLDLLLIEANRRLADLARRYRLEKNRGRDMDFVVVDLDLGGARRGLPSLSGGETFLVSLALALALATLAAPRSRVETLFLDEGFGTLDASNLEAALGALDSLQASGCQIGIISHVEGIAERIGAVVDVLPAGGGQSRIRVRTG